MSGMRRAAASHPTDGPFAVLNGGALYDAAPAVGDVLRRHRRPPATPSAFERSDGESEAAAA